MKSRVFVYQWLAGLCDTITGLLLIFAPARTLELMGVQRAPQPVAFVGFIGVFVLGVGLSYLYVACLPLNSKTAPRWQTVWWLTSLTRTLVSAFLAWQILAGRMEKAWLAVAITDGVLAVFQWIGLFCGWLEIEA